MGYYMQSGDSLFKILPENEEAALEAIQGLIGKETIVYAGGCHFSWVNQREFAEATSLDEVFYAWRWEIDRDNDKRVCAIGFIGEKLGDDNILFGAVAPHVEKDSYIEMKGEDELWRWYFDGEACEEQAGEVIYKGW